jgi:hypothetical protein
LKALFETSYGNAPHVKGIAGLVSIFAWGVVGAIFLKEAFQKRYFLKIYTGDDTRHIIFEKNTESSEIYDFMNALDTVFGYPVRSDIKHK